LKVNALLHSNIFLIPQSSLLRPAFSHLLTFPPSIFSDFQPFPLPPSIFSVPAYPLKRSAPQVKRSSRTEGPLITSPTFFLSHFRIPTSKHSPFRLLPSAFSPSSFSAFQLQSSLTLKRSALKAQRSSRPSGRSSNAVLVSSHFNLVRIRLQYR
jgi:hypothetical protein